MLLIILNKTGFLHAKETERFFQVLYSDLLKTKDVVVTSQPFHVFLILSNFVGEVDLINYYYFDFCEKLQ